MPTVNKPFLVKTGIALPSGDGVHAPLTFKQGANLTTLSAGTVEFDGYNLRITEASTNTTHIDNLSALVRRSVAYEDTTMLAKTADSIVAAGSTQATAIVITSDHSIISSTISGVSGLISAIGTIGSITGTGPWEATLENLTSTPDLTVGTIINAANDIGSIGTGGLYVVKSIISSTSVIYTATGGTSPIAGAVIEIEALFNGVVLPPAITGRTVRLVNASTNNINIFPLYAPANMVAGVGSANLVINVDTTAGLYPGMVVTVDSGIGEFALKTTVSAILSATAFAIDRVPNIGVTSGAIISTNQTATTINSISANFPYQLAASTAVEFISATDHSWWTTAAAAAGNSSGTIIGSPYRIGDIVYANSGFTLAPLHDIAAGNVLLSGGELTAPVYGKVQLTAGPAQHVEGILPIVNGGTGTDGTGLAINLNADLLDGQHGIYYANYRNLTNKPISSGTIAPEDPVINDLWWDTDTGTLFIYYFDGTGYQWVESTPHQKQILVEGPAGTYTLTGNIIITGDETIEGTLYETSDRRLKDNIQTIATPLDTVQQLNGVTFDWIKTNKHSMGLIAQEVEQVLPYLIQQDLSGVKSINYTAIIGLLIEAVKDLDSQIKNTAPKPSIWSKIKKIVGSNNGN
jgi:hypothetical protein